MKKQAIVVAFLVAAGLAGGAVISAQAHPMHPGTQLVSRHAGVAATTHVHTLPRMADAMKQRGTSRPYGDGDPGH